MVAMSRGLDRFVGYRGKRGSAPASEPVQVSVQMWAALGFLVVGMIVVDFLAFGRGRREVTVREAAVWTVGWFAIALGFGALLGAWQGGQASSEYLAGFLLERSLSLDNIFVFAVIFSYFMVPPAVQPRVLAWGIALALVLRLAFILIGAALLANFYVTYYLFGALLVYTAWRIYRHDDTGIEPEHNPALKLLRRRVPMTGEYHGGRLTIREGGHRITTPLVAVFVVVATTDVVFAVDSIPAIFAVTQDPYIVFAANAFAMLGLRALYFLLVGAMDRFAYLSYGLSAILAFIGVKMLLLELWHPPFWVSLVVIVGVLTATALASLRVTAPRPGAIDRAPGPEESGHEPPVREREARRAETEEAEPVGAGRSR
jgi:tellurite resistance protein TerC